MKHDAAPLAAMSVNGTLRRNPIAVLRSAFVRTSASRHETRPRRQIARRHARTTMLTRHPLKVAARVEFVRGCPSLRPAKGPTLQARQKSFAGRLTCFPVKVGAIPCSVAEIPCSDC